MGKLEARRMYFGNVPVVHLSNWIAKVHLFIPCSPYFILAEVGGVGGRQWGLGVSLGGEHVRCQVVPLTCCRTKSNACAVVSCILGEREVRLVNSLKTVPKFLTPFTINCSA